jgi:hypothetical protein
LHALAGERERKYERPLVAREHADLERTERPPGVTIGGLHEKVTGLGQKRDLLTAEPVRPVVDGPLDAAGAKEAALARAAAQGYLGAGA